MSEDVNSDAAEAQEWLDALDSVEAFVALGARPDEIVVERDEVQRRLCRGVVRDPNR